MLVLLGAASYSIVRNKQTQTHKTKIVVWNYLFEIILCYEKLNKNN